DSLERITVEKGELVVRQGEASTAMFFVEEGRLRALWQTEEGKRGDVAYIRRGDFFGERSLLLGAPRAVSVEAVTPATLLVLHEPEFRRLLESDAAFRTAGEPCAHPAACAHVDRRDEPGRDRERCRAGRAARALREGVENPARGDAAAGGLPHRGEPLGRPLSRRRRKSPRRR